MPVKMQTISHTLKVLKKYCYQVINTGCSQMNGAVSEVKKKCTSYLTRAKRTPSAAATVPVSHVLITVLQCVHPGSHDTHPHSNAIHPRFRRKTHLLR